MAVGSRGLRAPFSREDGPWSVGYCVDHRDEGDHLRVWALGDAPAIELEVSWMSAAMKAALAAGPDEEGVIAVPMDDQPRVVTVYADPDHVASGGAVAADDDRRSATRYLPGGGGAAVALGVATVLARRRRSSGGAKGEPEPAPELALVEG